MDIKEGIELSRLDQHSAFGFLFYYLIYIIWTGRVIMDFYAVFLIVFFSMCPDLDIFYGGAKKGGLQQLDEDFQHHYFSVAHYPIVYTPVIILFIISLVFDFYPLYFLTPVIGIYFGHFLFDTIACGDGIMWGKNPFNKNRYAHFINVWYSKTDGYHGFYWEARYRQTLICKIGNIAVIVSAVIMQIFHILETFRMFPVPTYNVFYLGPLVYFLGLLYFGLQKTPEEFINEPSKGRYADYRVDPKYINGLSQRNKRNHLEKYSFLFEK
jgi:hypothetical protein